MNVLQQLHCLGIVYSYRTRILLIEEHLVNVTEIKYLLNEVVVGGPVFDFRLHVTHVNMCVSAGARLLDFMVN